jgi:hypothetical protein
MKKRAYSYWIILTLLLLAIHLFVHRFMMLYPPNLIFIKAFGFSLIIGLSTIVYNTHKKLKQKAEQQEEIKDFSHVLEAYNKVLITYYEVKPCYNCGESEIKLGKISPTGKSFDCECTYCNKKQVRKLISGSGDELLQVVSRYKAELYHDLNNPDLIFTLIRNINHKNSNKRRTIPEQVRNEVWRRDKGKCVNCNSNENLEFDHIIPHSKGGADTVRNLQLLCQACNRSKSNKI